MVSVLVAFAAAPSARAQSVFFGSSDFHLVRQLAAPVTVTGSVVVQYRGDGVDGTVVWTAPRGARLDAARFRSRRGRGVIADLSFETDSGAGLVTSAHVERTAPDGTVHTCTDVATSEYATLFSDTLSARLPFRLAGDQLNLVTTRCAGPLPSRSRHRSSRF